MKDNQELKDLDDLIQKELQNTQSMALNNAQQLYQGSEKIEEIKDKRLVNIKNENKKSKWFVGGIKSTGKWFKNFFSTPKMDKKQQDDDQKQESPQQEKIEDEFDQLHCIVKNNNKEIRKQNLQMQKMNQDLKKELQNTKKLNNDISKIIN